MGGESRQMGCGWRGKGMKASQVMGAWGGVGDRTKGAGGLDLVAYVMTATRHPVTILPHHPMRWTQPSRLIMIYVTQHSKPSHPP